MLWPHTKPLNTTCHDPETVRITSSFAKESNVDTVCSTAMNVKEIPGR